MRNINIPRPLAIPNPFSYQLQCEMLRDNWCNLQTHFDEKTGACQYKVSRIHIRKMYDFPALFQMNYDNWRVDGDPETDLLMGKRYMVNADISTCFTSIYTHSLSWALVGKEMAKQNRNTKVWYNMIDNATRKTTHDETVVLLSKGEIDSKKVRVEFSLEDMDMSGFQKGATYEQIKAYVLKHTGLKVSSLYISQVKRKCGLDVGQNYNLSKKEDAKVPQCPPEKEAAIMEALKHFQMLE